MKTIAEYSAKLFIDRGVLKMSTSKRVGNRVTGRIMPIGKRA